METTKIICASCGQTEERTDKVIVDTYFPHRWVYSEHYNPIRCKNCNDNSNMIIFGSYYIQFTKLHDLPHVKENNEIYQLNNSKIFEQYSFKH